MTVLSAILNIVYGVESQDRHLEMGFFLAVKKIVWKGNSSA